MKILLTASVEDSQTGLYIHNALIELGHQVATLDNKMVMKKYGIEFLRNQYVEALSTLKPDLSLVIKGEGLNADTLKKGKELHHHKLIGWVFDVTVGGIMVKDAHNYVEMLKVMDQFYTIDKSALEELRNLGVNADWLSEGCDVEYHKPAIYNSYQARKYGADVVFLGSVGGIHPNREKILQRVFDEGFNLKLYGEVYYEKGTEPEFVKKCHTGYEAINDMHSLACQASKIVIGMDGWPHREGAWSARVYRTLCAGGFLLTTKTEGMDNIFKPGEHLDYFESEDELIEKIIKYLGDDEARERISKAGMELVQKEHTFQNRLTEMLSKA